MLNKKENSKFEFWRIFEPRLWPYHSVCFSVCLIFACIFSVCLSVCLHRQRERKINTELEKREGARANKSTFKKDNNTYVPEADSGGRQQGNRPPEIPIF